MDGLPQPPKQKASSQIQGIALKKFSEPLLKSVQEMYLIYLHSKSTELIVSNNPRM